VTLLWCGAGVDGGVEEMTSKRSGQGLIGKTPHRAWTRNLPENYKMKPLILLALIVILITATSRCCFADGQKRGDSAMKRDAKYFLNHSFDLLSDTVTEKFLFGENDVVLAYVGLKTVIAAPAYHWKIENQETLVIMEEDNHVQEFKFKKLDNDKAVTTDGQIFKRDVWK
jgi:hypothetical protein